MHLVIAKKKKKKIKKRRNIEIRHFDEFGSSSVKFQRYQTVEPNETSIPVRERVYCTIISLGIMRLFT